MEAENTSPLGLDNSSGTYSGGQRTPGHAGAPVRRAVEQWKYNMKQGANGVQYECSECASTYKHKKSLNKHWKDKHLDLLQTGYTGGGLKPAPSATASTTGDAETKPAVSFQTSSTTSSTVSPHTPLTGRSYAVPAPTSQSTPRPMSSVLSSQFQFMPGTPPFQKHYGYQQGFGMPREPSGSLKRYREDISASPSPTQLPPTSLYHISSSPSSSHPGKRSCLTPINQTVRSGIQSVFSSPASLLPPMDTFRQPPPPPFYSQSVHPGFHLGADVNLVSRTDENKGPLQNLQITPFPGILDLSVSQKETTPLDLSVKKDNKVQESSNSIQHHSAFTIVTPIPRMAEMAPLNLTQSNHPSINFQAPQSMYNSPQIPSSSTQSVTQEYLQQILPPQIQSQVQPSSFPKEPTTTSSIPRTMDLSICYQCKRTCTNVSILNQHFVETHERILHEEADKSDKSRPSFNLQLTNEELNNFRQGTDENSLYKCNQCDYSTKFATEFNRHYVRKHRRDKPCRCCVCGQNYKWRWDLARHFNKQHSTIIINPYSRFLNPDITSSTVSSKGSTKYRKKNTSQNFVTTSSKELTQPVNTPLTSYHQQQPYYQPQAFPFSQQQHSVQKQLMHQSEASYTPQLPPSSQQELFPPQTQHTLQSSHPQQSLQQNQHHLLYHQQAPQMHSFPQSENHYHQQYLSQQHLCPPQQQTFQQKPPVLQEEVIPQSQTVAQQQSLTHQLAVSQQQVSHQQQMPPHQELQTQPEHNASSTSDGGDGQPEMTILCSQCQYRARWPSELRSHIVNHSGHRAYGCQFCGYRAKWKWDVAKHLKRCREAVGKISLPASNDYLVQFVTYFAPPPGDILLDYLDEDNRQIPSSILNDSESRQIPVNTDDTTRSSQFTQASTSDTATHDDLTFPDRERSPPLLERVQESCEDDSNVATATEVDNVEEVGQLVIDVAGTSSGDQEIDVISSQSAPNPGEDDDQPPPLLNAEENVDIEGLTDEPKYNTTIKSEKRLAPSPYDNEESHSTSNSDDSKLSSVKLEHETLEPRIRITLKRCPFCDFMSGSPKELQEHVIKHTFDNDIDQ